MERVIRCGFGLLLALILPIWNAQGEQAPADDLPDFNVVPENAARAVLLHAATPECDTVHCSLSIEAGQPRARGDYEIVLSSNQYADRTPTVVTEEGSPLTWLRSTSSESWSNGMDTRICRHFYRFSPAKKGEYRLLCRDLSFDGVAYDGVLMIHVGAPELNAVPSFLLWVAGIGCLLLVEVFIRIGCRNEARVDTADFIRRHRRLPLNAEGGLGPLPASDHVSLSSALHGHHHPHGYGVYLDQRASLDLGCLRPGGFHSLPPPIPQTFLPLEKNGAAAGADRRFASGTGRAVRLDDRPHGPGFFCRTHPSRMVEHHVG